MTNGSNNSCVLFFVKYPVKGQVKTRLAAELDKDIVVELYRNFVLDTLSVLERLGVPFRICFYPESTEEKFIEWLGREYSYMAQTGADLGRRMKNAFEKTFNENFNRAILIGSDIPDLPKEYLAEALDALESNDVVIGPSNDGGYYLIGFSQSSFLPEAFDNIALGSDSVFEQTVSILKRNKRDMFLLPLWDDVDTINDLKSLLSRTKDTRFEKSRTYLYLTSHGLGSLLNV